MREKNFHAEAQGGGGRGDLWFGEVPQTWSLKRLASYFSERKDKVSDRDYPPLSVTKNGVLPQLENVAKSMDGDNRKLVKKGDFVINSRSDRKGSSGVSLQDGSVSLINIVLQPRRSLCGEYCNYLLKSKAFVEENYRNGRGIVADLWTTRYDEMKMIKIPLPPLPEQEAIVKYLDAETAKIDKAIAAEEKMIALLQERRQGVLRAPWGAAESAPCKTWGKRRIKTMASKIGSGKTPKGGANVYSGNGILFIRSQNVYNEGLYLEEDVAHISAAIDDDMKGTRVCRGDLLLNITGGSIGRCCIYDRDEPANVNQHVCIIRIIESIANARFVQYFINAYACDIVGINQTGGNREGLNFQSIGNITIPLPPLSEQERIVKYLDAETGKIDRAIEVKRRQIALLRERREIVINEVVTGKVKVA